MDRLADKAEKGAEAVVGSDKQPVAAAAAGLKKDSNV